MYLTRADLATLCGETELVQLTDHDGLGVADESRLARAIADAEAEADGYVGARYALPLASVPAALAARVADIARYRLYADAPTETVATRYREAVAYLRDIARGTVALGLDPAPAPATGAVVVTSGPGRDWRRP